MGGLRFSHFGIAGTGKRAGENAGRVGDQQGSGGRARDDQQFSRLQQNDQIPFFHEVADDDGPEHDEDANDCKHRPQNDLTDFSAELGESCRLADVAEALCCSLAQHD